MPDLTKEDVVKILAGYEDLLIRASQVTNKSPHYSSVDFEDDIPYLTLDGDEVVIQWREYESDYYGGGYCTTETTRFPLDVLLLTEAELKAMQAKVEAEKKARDEKVRRAQAIIAAERQEAHERAVLAQLKAKYEKI